MVLSPLVFQLNPASCQLVGCAHKLRYEPCRRAVWSSWEPFLKCQGLGILVLGGVPPEGFQFLNGFAARPLQANDTWRKRLPFNRCWQFGPGLSRAGTVTYPRCGGCQVSVGYRRAWCLAIAHLYSYAQMANFVRAGHRKRFCPSLCLPAC